MSFITDMRPVQRPDGTSVANDWSDFLDPNVTILNGIESTGTDRYWTGMRRLNGAADRVCSDWTSNNAGVTGNVGAAILTDGDRIRFAWYNCNLRYHILCASY